MNHNYSFPFLFIILETRHYREKSLYKLKVVPNAFVDIIKEKGIEDFVVNPVIINVNEINVKYNYKEKKRNKNICFIMSLFVFNFSNYLECL